MTKMQVILTLTLTTRPYLKHPHPPRPLLPTYITFGAVLSDGHVKYANSYCWVRNTYYLSWDDEIPRDDEPRETVMYYQWVSRLSKCSVP